jgi:hypothetical protein
LAEPFPAQDIEWRVGRSGMSGGGKPWAFVLAYVTARGVQHRLDEVCGPENWRPEYVFHPNGGVICRLSIRVDGEWIAKEDGAEQTDIEAFKGGISGALKRAASVWGLGRYLYGLEESFARFVEDGTHGAYKVKIESRYFSWLPPELPAWALPPNSSPPQAPLASKDPAPKAKVAPRAKAASIVQTPAPVPAAAHPLDDYKVTSGEVHKGKTFKELKAELGEQGMLEYFKKAQDWFVAGKRPITPQWQELFSKAEEYLFGGTTPPQGAK